MEGGRNLSDILEIYGCDDNPIVYMIEPRISVEITNKGAKTDPSDYENLLD